MNKQADMRKPEGFRGQIYRPVIPRVQEELKAHPLGADFHMVAAGWFPRARHHFIERRAGADDHILILCVEGKGEAWTAGMPEPAPVEPGMVLLIRAKEAHGYQADPRNPWSIYWAHFGGISAPLFCGLLPSGKPLLRLGKKQREECVHWFEKMLHELSAGPGLREALLSSHSLRYLLAACVFQHQGLPGPEPDREDAPISEAIRFLHMRLDRSIPLGELSRAAGLSQSRFSTLFRLRTGLSPVEYHIRRRMRKACLLLDTTRKSVKEIAAELGYEDPYYFSRIFRKVTGLSPKKHRDSSEGFAISDQA